MKVLTAVIRVANGAKSVVRLTQEEFLSVTSNECLHLYFWALHGIWLQLTWENPPWVDGTQWFCKAGRVDVCILSEVSAAGLGRWSVLPEHLHNSLHSRTTFFFFFKLQEKAAQYSLSYGLENIELFLKYNFPTSLPKIVKCIFSSCNLTAENAHL